METRKQILLPNESEHFFYEQYGSIACKQIAHFRIAPLFVAALLVVIKFVSSFR